MKKGKKKYKEMQITYSRDQSDNFECGIWNQKFKNIHLSCVVLKYFFKRFEKLFRTLLYFLESRSFFVKSSETEAFVLSDPIICKSNDNENVFKRFETLYQVSVFIFLTSQGCEQHEGA